MTQGACANHRDQALGDFSSVTVSGVPTGIDTDVQINHGDVGTDFERRV